MTIGVPEQQQRRRRTAQAVQAVYDQSYPPGILQPPATLPTITSLTPSSIPVNTSRSVALVGTGFTAGGKVNVDGVDQPTTFVDATHCSYTAIASSVGTQTVRYANSMPRVLTITATQEDAATESESGQDTAAEPLPEPDPVPEPAPTPDPAPEP